MVNKADHPATAPHELRGSVLYDQHGDSPYWALRELLQELDGGEDGIDVVVDQEQWEVSVGYQKSGLEPRPQDDVDSLYEYRINAYGNDQRKLPLLIQPRLDWKGDNRPNSVPKDLGLATNVKIETAVNLEPEEIERLIPAIMRGVARHAGVDWNGEYFEGPPHRYSSITQYERYYRLERGQARKIVRTDGIFHRLFHLLAEREGSKVVYSADNTEIVGYNHQVRLDKDAANRLLEDAQRGKQFKHYHPKHVRGDDSGDPLYHPKLGCLFKKGWNANNSVPWHEHPDLARELEENLVNLLHWANIPSRCGPTFIADDHFDAEPSDREVAIFEDPTPEIERDQDSVLVSTMSRLTDRDLDVLEGVALTDGGEAHVAELEQETGWATSTIYRALGTLDELLENENGNVSFISEKIQQRVREVVERTQEVVNAQARIVEDVLDVDPRDLERAGRAWQNWLHRYGAELIDHGRDTKIRVRTLMSRLKSASGEYAPEVVEYGAIAWVKAGRDPAEFRNAMIEYDTASGTETMLAKNLLAETG
jgi:hypothetical protein